MQDVVEHTSKAFLGLTIACARCHDHMYDPIVQEDYYRLRAVFEPHRVRIDRVPGQMDTKADGLARAYDADAGAKTFVFIRGDDRQPDKDRPMLAQSPILFGSDGFRVEPVSLPATAYYPDLREHVHATLLRQAEADWSKAREALTARQTERNKVKALVAAAGGNGEGALPAETRKDLAASGQHNLRDAELAVVLAERAVAAAEARREALGARIAAEKGRYAQPPAANRNELAKLAAAAERRAALAAAEETLAREEHAAHRLRHGDEQGKKQLPEAEKKVAAAQRNVDAARQAAASPGETYAPLGPVYPATSTGRRLALARWIARRENPLTARVAVNHIWLRHFGRALVPTVFDFGHNGQPPTHPALLDWLAAEWLGAQGDGAEGPSGTVGSAAGESWRMKRLHRLIVTSSTYRLASTPDAAMLAADPDNVWLWRFGPRRLEAEAVRDNVLYVSGGLDLARGGPDLDHRQGLALRRRSLYFRHAPEKQMEFLKLFDAAAPTQCYERRESVVPQQALALANSRLTWEAARRLARSLAAEGPDEPAAFAAAAVERVLGRPATADEVALCATFLDEQTRFFEAHRSRLAPAAAHPADVDKPSADPAVRARESVIHALFNHHDFVTLK
jgi:hypothetical protein